MSDELLLIKRGYIYEFQPKSAFDGRVFALAVSANNRAADNLVSIIILSPNPAPGCVQIVNSQFQENVLYCNCGKVTSTERSRLIREVAKVSEQKMEKIDRLLVDALGINPLEILAENKIYKELYFELLERLIGDKLGKTDSDKD